MYEDYIPPLANKFISLSNKLGFFDLYNIYKNYSNPQATILMYHRVNSNRDNWSIDTTDTKLFEKEMKYLKRTYNFLSLEDLADKIKKKERLPKRSVVITFDDGYKDNYKEAYPILKKYKIPATIFLTSSFIEKDKIFWWDQIGYTLFHSKSKKVKIEKIGEIDISYVKENQKYFDKIIEKFKVLPEEKRNEILIKLIKKLNVKIPNDIFKNISLSWDEINEMSKENIDFGAHTVNHLILTNLSIKKAKSEILESKKEIEKRLGKKISTFSYPNGLRADYNNEIIKILKENKFKCAVTAIPNTVDSKTNLFELGRISPGWTFDTFKFFISGLYQER